MSDCKAVTVHDAGLRLQQLNDASSNRTSKGSHRSCEPFTFAKYCTFNKVHLQTKLPGIKGKLAVNFNFNFSNFNTRSESVPSTRNLINTHTHLRTRSTSTTSPSTSQTATMSAEAEQKVKLVSSDNVEIETGEYTRTRLTTTATDSSTERKIAERSMLIKNMIEDLGAPGEEPIPIMNVSHSPSTSTSPPSSRADPTSTGLRSRPAQGARVVHPPQERPGADPR